MAISRIWKGLDRITWAWELKMMHRVSSRPQVVA